MMKILAQGNDEQIIESHQLDYKIGQEMALHFLI